MYLLEHILLIGTIGENKNSMIKDVYWHAEFKTLTHLFPTGLLRAFNVQTSMWIPDLKKKGSAERPLPPVDDGALFIFGRKSGGMGV